MTDFVHPSSTFTPSDRTVMRLRLHHFAISVPDLDAAVAPTQTI